jgi:hypothetical protein
MSNGEYDLEVELAAVMAVLWGQQIPHALCGGLALAIHGHPRATRDIDFLVPGEAVENALSALKLAGFTLRAGPIPLGTNTDKPRRLFRATKVFSTEHLTVDLLEAAPTYSNAWSTRQEFVWNGKPLSIVSRQGLIEMKKLSTRPKDLVDVEILEGRDDENH